MADSLRRSEWRSRADDPKDTLGWWWRGIREEGGGFLLAMYAWVAVAMFFLPLPWGPATAVTGYILYGGFRALWQRDELRPLLADPALEGQFRAMATYRHKGLTLGTDEMAITVVDGWLIGEGLRTDFALRPGDVCAWHLNHPCGARLTLMDDTTVQLAWHDQANDLALSEWRSSKGPIEGEPTFPPMQANVQEIVRWKSWLWAGIIMFALLCAPEPIRNHLPSRILPKDLCFAFMMAALGVVLVGGGRLRRLMRSPEIKLAPQEALAGNAPPLREVKEERIIRTR